MKKKRLAGFLYGACFGCLLSCGVEHPPKVVHVTDTIYVEREKLVKEDSASEKDGQDADSLVERDCKIGSFSKLSVANKIQVVYTHGKTYTVKVKGLKKTINKHFKARVENNTLLLYLEDERSEKNTNKVNVRQNSGNIVISNGVSVSSQGFSDAELGEIRVTVTSPSLNYVHTSGEASFSSAFLSDKGSITLEASGCSMVNVEKLSCGRLYTEVSGSCDFDLGHVFSQTFDCTVNGASNLTISRLVSLNIKIEGSGSSQVNANIDCKRLDCSMSGASCCLLLGKAEMKNFNTSGASNIVME